MTTDQTIDGVPRELAERFAQYAESGKVAEHGMVEELRALLDAPADKCDKCYGAGKYLISTVCGMTHKLCDCAKPAAQPQGEPVADLIRLDRSYRNGLMAGFQFGITGDKNGYADCIQRYNAGIKEAKAEQPAPVAVALPVDPERERLMEIVQQYPNVDPLKYDAAVRTLRK